MTDYNQPALPGLGAPAIDDVIDAIVTARGCGCCASMDDLAAIVPCGAECAADEDGYVEHTYGFECAHNFRAAVRRLLDAAANRRAE